jgi:hypothetical protein
MTFPGARRYAGVLFWFVLPALALLMVVLSVNQLRINGPLRQPGVPGAFTVEGRGCFHGVCAMQGRFTSDDLTLVGEHLQGDQRWLVGQVYRVRWDGNGTEVFTEPSRRDPAIQLMAISGAGLYLLVTGYLLLTTVVPRRRRRA